MTWYHLQRGIHADAGGQYGSQELSGSLMGSPKITKTAGQLLMLVAVQKVSTDSRLISLKTKISNRLIIIILNYSRFGQRCQDGQEADVEVRVQEHRAAESPAARAHT